MEIGSFTGTLSPGDPERNTRLGNPCESVRVTGPLPPPCRRITARPFAAPLREPIR